MAANSLMLALHNWFYVNVGLPVTGACFVPFLFTKQADSEGKREGKQSHERYSFFKQRSIGLKSQTNAVRRNYSINFIGG